MLYKTFALLLGSLVFATPLSTTGDTTLALGFESDVTFSRTVSTKGELELNFAIIIDEEEQDIGADAINMIYSEELRYVDTIEAMVDGAPSALTRVYEHLLVERTIETPEESIEETLNSPLDGETVVFKWNAEDEEWNMSLPEDAESEVEQDILDDLTPDMDLFGLLPTEEVSVGDSWDVGSDLYLTLSWPGGIIPYLGEEEEERDEEDADEARQRFANVEAEGTATLSSIDDGVATITVVMEASTSAETEMEMDAGEHGEAPEMTRVQESTTSYEIEVLWDLEGGYWTEITVQDATAMTIDEVGNFEGPDGEIEFIQRRSFEGEIEVTWTNELKE